MLIKLVAISLLPLVVLLQMGLKPDSNRLPYISYKLLAASCKRKYKGNLSKVYHATYLKMVQSL